MPEENASELCETEKGAFSIYDGKGVEIVGYTSCNGCPGGNIEYAPEEMLKNGAQIIHLATGLVVGYPPCRSINSFSSFISRRYGLKVVVGTHPIPQKYYIMHKKLGTWESTRWQRIIQSTLADEKTRLAYD